MGEKQLTRADKTYFSIFGALLIIFGAAMTGINNSAQMVSNTSQDIIERQQIVLDAGHGGLDGGSVAADDTVEKDINLAITLKLKDILNFMGFDVILTRETDVSLHDETKKTTHGKKVSDLENRLDIINDHPDSIFISIHQNHFPQSKYKGTQVFYSSNNEESIKIAQSIQQRIINDLQNDNNRAIKDIGTASYLMKNSKVPSVLIECGFISNNEDLANLKNDEYQKKFSFSVLCGLMEAVNQQNQNTFTHVTDVFE